MLVTSCPRADDTDSNDVTLRCRPFRHIGYNASILRGAGVSDHRPTIDLPDRERISGVAQGVSATLRRESVSIRAHPAGFGWGARILCYGERQMRSRYGVVEVFEESDDRQGRGVPRNAGDLALRGAQCRPERREKCLVTIGSAMSKVAPSFVTRSQLRSPYIYLTRYLDVDMFHV